MLGRSEGGGAAVALVARCDRVVRWDFGRGPCQEDYDGTGTAGGGVGETAGEAAAAEPRVQEVASHDILPAQYVQGFLVRASAGTKYERKVSEKPLLASTTLGFPYLVLFYLNQGSQLDCESLTTLMAALERGHLRPVNIYYKLGRSLITIQNICAKHYILHVQRLIFERLVPGEALGSWSSLVTEAAKAGHVAMVNIYPRQRGLSPQLAGATWRKMAQGEPVRG
ncbi:hypothetical protein BDZ91DRAFT_762666 [Kalaharituber pfeilii]|nr:hypothetical protein BDZ91DRAFT_762666 [Kalaharituber pfeilii]